MNAILHVAFRHSIHSRNSIWLIPLLALLFALLLVLVVSACSDTSFDLTVGAVVSGSSASTSTSYNVAYYSTLPGVCSSGGYYQTQYSQSKIDWSLLHPGEQETDHSYGAGTVGLWSYTNTTSSTCANPLPYAISKLGGGCIVTPVKMDSPSGETTNPSLVGSAPLGAIALVLLVYRMKSDDEDEDQENRSFLSDSSRS